MPRKIIRQSQPRPLLPTSQLSRNPSQYATTRKTVSFVCYTLKQRNQTLTHIDSLLRIRRPQRCRKHCSRITSQLFQRTSPMLLDNIITISLVLQVEVLQRKEIPKLTKRRYIDKEQKSYRSKLDCAMSKDLKTKSGTELNFLHLLLIQTNLCRQKTIPKSQFNKNRMQLLITVMSHSYLRISPPNNRKYFTALCRRKLTFLLLRLVDG